MKIARVAYKGQDFIAKVSEDEKFELYKTSLAAIMNGSSLENPQGTVGKVDVRLLPPVEPVRNIMCAGLNYQDHAQESLTAAKKEVKLPEVPIIFTKATTAAAGPYDRLTFSEAVLDTLDWEVELGVVIGKQCKNVSEEEAWDVIFGLTIVNDLSARTQQKAGKQFFKGKSFDQSCPFGPWIVTMDEFSKPLDLRLSSFVNGIKKQESSTAKMIFSVPQLVSYLSTDMTLLPGDIIATGTPGGVGFARDPQEFLRHGNFVRCEIEGIGYIENTVVKES